MAPGPMERVPGVSSCGLLVSHCLESPEPLKCTVPDYERSARCGLQGGRDLGSHKEPSQGRYRSLMTASARRTLSASSWLSRCFGGRHSASKGPITVERPSWPGPSEPRQLLPRPVTKDLTGSRGGLTRAKQVRVAGHSQVHSHKDSLGEVFGTGFTRPTGVTEHAGTSIPAAW